MFDEALNTPDCNTSFFLFVKEKLMLCIFEKKNEKGMIVPQALTNPEKNQAQR